MAHKHTDHTKHDPNPIMNYDSNQDPKEETLFGRMKAGAKHIMHHNEDRGSGAGPDYTDNEPAPGGARAPGVGARLKDEADATGQAVKESMGGQKQ